MGSDSRAAQVATRDQAIRAALIDGGWCPNCTNPKGPANQRRTLVDHCMAFMGKRCPQGWLLCERCGAYGTAESFTYPKPREE